jgi:hypothetical protein
MRTVTGSVPSHRTKERKIAASKRRMRPSADASISSLATGSSWGRIRAVHARQLRPTFTRTHGFASMLRT